MKNEETIQSGHSTTNKQTHTNTYAYTHLSGPLFTQDRRDGFQSIRRFHASRHIVSPKHINRLSRLFFFRYLHRNDLWRRRWLDDFLWPSIDGINVHGLLSAHDNLNKLLCYSTILRRDLVAMTKRRSTMIVIVIQSVSRNQIDPFLLPWMNFALCTISLSVNELWDMTDGNVLSAKGFE